MRTWRRVAMLLLAGLAAALTGACGEDSRSEDIFECALPCLVTISHELGELRSANVKGLMAAQKQPFTSWQAGELDIDPASINNVLPLKLYIPEKEVVCDIVPGDTPEEAGANLAVKLSEIM